MENIARIEEYTAGMDGHAFAADKRTADAVERCSARISEAAVKLGDDAERLCPDIPWRDIRGLGNRLRHAYTTVDVTRIWLIVDKDLPALKEACREALGRIEGDKAV
ncbi:MAG: DUF86 domain-containing protein [Kiloniellaceae bacterium]